MNTYTITTEHHFFVVVGLLLCFFFHSHLPLQCLRGFNTDMFGFSDWPLTCWYHHPWADSPQEWPSSYQCHVRPISRLI